MFTVIPTHQFLQKTKTLWPIKMISMQFVLNDLKVLTFIVPNGVKKHAHMTYPLQNCFSLLCATLWEHPQSLFYLPKKAMSGKSSFLCQRMCVTTAHSSCHGNGRGAWNTSIFLMTLEWISGTLLRITHPRFACILV